MSTSSLSAAPVNPNIFDTGSLSSLKRQVQSNDPQALKTAARQFEALFLQIVLKSMRDATPREGLFDSDQTRMYESLLDQQLAQVIGTKGNGTGLAAMIEKQLLRMNEEPGLFEGGLPLRLPDVPGLKLQDKVTPLRPLDSGNGGGGLPLQRGAAVAPAVDGDMSSPAPGAREFVNRIWPAAAEASRDTGIPAHFMVAQAALETGWGRSEPRRADGSPSYNIFGIKAGRNWSGPVVEANTTEYVDGKAQRSVERFRAYGSYAEAFRDYAGLLAGNPRYAGLVGTRDAASFAGGLQRAGYATDPAYASKLMRIIGGDTLRQALTG